MSYQPKRTTSLEEEQLRSVRLFTTVSWISPLISGIAWFALGILALLLPLTATITFELFFGIVLLLGGIVQTIAAIGARHYLGFWPMLIGGLAGVLAGGFLLFAPLAGIAIITLLIGTLLAADGITRIIFAVQHSGIHGRFWPMLNGFLTLFLGLLVLAAWPAGSAFLLGYLVGVALLVNGVSSIAFAINLRQLEDIF